MGVVMLFALASTVRAEQPARTWEFDLKPSGTYKVQVEHRIDGIAPGTKVTYSVSIGTETQTRELDLIANRPFIPLIADILGPRKMRVVVAGLTESALQHTRVYAYDANSLPPGEYFDPAKTANFEEAARIRAILRRSADKIDLARTKLTVDKMVDHAIDVEAWLKKIDAIVAKIRTMPEYGASSTSKLVALKRYVYEPGEWNDHRPFQYDLDDPFGAKLSNKLLPTYLATKKGNCITMPLLFVILGQRLGIDVTASTAPKHVVVKFRDDTAGTWINLEATSGANPARDAWIREQMPMTDEALANGLYLQPLTKKETVAVMAGTLAEYYLREHEYRKAIAISDLTLAYYPKDVGAMLAKAVGYGRLARKEFNEKYPTPDQIPANARGYFQYLSQNNRLWFAKAEGLGWREETKADEERYAKRVNSVRQHSSTD